MTIIFQFKKITTFVQLILRNNKNIFSVINLIFFLGSFFLCAYIGLSKSTLLSDKYHHEVKLASHNKQDISDINYLLVEENENENEDSFELVGFILPFFISDFEINFFILFFLNLVASIIMKQIFFVSNLF